MNTDLIAIDFLDYKNPGQKPDSESYSVYVHHDGDLLGHKRPRDFYRLIPAESVLGFRVNDYPHGSHGIALQFLTRGLPGPTYDTGTKSFRCEVLFNAKKYMWQLNPRIGVLIPSFSILAVLQRTEKGAWSRFFL